MMTEFAALETELVRLSERSDQLAVDLVAAADNRTALRAAATAAEQRVHEAESERRAWTARADALSLALEEARAASGAERLADIDGVLGTLLELIDIDEGWESAFEAAAGISPAVPEPDGFASVRVRLTLRVTAMVMTTTAANATNMATPSEPTRRRCPIMEPEAAAGNSEVSPVTAPTPRLTPDGGTMRALELPSRSLRPFTSAVDMATAERSFPSRSCACM